MSTSTTRELPMLRPPSCGKSSPTMRATRHSIQRSSTYELQTYLRGFSLSSVVGSGSTQTPSSSSRFATFRYLVSVNGHVYRHLRSGLRRWLRRKEPTSPGPSATREAPGNAPRGTL